MLGMTWARGAIFFGSDTGREWLKARGHNEVISTTLPPMLIGTFVQVVNMPLVRGTITIQDPNSNLANVREALVYIYKARGIQGLWHGVSPLY